MSERKARQRLGLCLLEGVRLVESAQAAGLALDPILYAPERLAATAAGRALRKRLEHLAEAEEVADGVFRALSDTVTSQGVVAAAPIPPPLPLLAEGPVLVLDAIADPGNAGTIIRSAHAAGAAGVVALRGTADLWAPRTLRAAMGSHFQVPLQVNLDWEQLAAALHPRPLLIAAARGGPFYWDVDLRGPIAIVIGSEARGASSAAQAAASSSICIPMAAGAESLNAAAAAAILLFEAVRQRGSPWQPAP
ncbi:MAG TPA: RNA methyltransferase [Chloroflexota bacterium]|nr:RNA methyltransferase [Chloroflexota bacterium]